MVISDIFFYSSPVLDFIKTIYYNCLLISEIILTWLDIQIMVS